MNICSAEFFIIIQVNGSTTAAIENAGFQEYCIREEDVCTK